MRKSFWDRLENQREYLDRLGKQLHFTSREDWYGISADSVARFGGKKILARFDGSALKMVRAVYPEHSWTVWKFKEIDPQFWTKRSNHEQYLNWLGEQLEIKDMDGWYEIKKEQVLKLGGSDFLSKYGFSLSRALQAIYPNHDWIIWNFRQVPPGYWEEARNLEDFVRWLTKKLEIKNLEDWYRISLKNLEKIAQVTPFRTMGMAPMLQTAYPNHIWDLDKLSSRKGIRSSQKLMVILLESIFKDTEVFEDYLHEDLLFKSGNRMQLDAFIPKYFLAFEYQGEQHFQEIYSLGPLWRYSERDREKRIACSDKGITLIEIPYWWDFTKESLIASIHSSRPDIISSQGTGIPIPKDPPVTLTKKSKTLWFYHNLVGHGEPPLSLAQFWDRIQDVTGWWISEKLDGIRVYWDGLKLYYRNGRQIHAPNEFILELPQIKLDGELWSGRGKFDLLISILSSGLTDWSGVIFAIFDIVGSNQSYQARLETLHKIAWPKCVTVLEAEVCQGKEHLERCLNSILLKGGEGLILRDPISPYIAGRSSSFLKLKPLHDSEVLVLEVSPVGLRCEQPNGVECIVQCDQQILQNPPPIGSIITVKHCGHRFNGNLRYPQFWRERKDVSWDSVVTSYHSTLNSPWSKSEYQRSLMDYLGKQLGVNQMEDWYSVSVENLAKKGGGSGILAQFGNSITRVLESVYPHHEWLPWKFSKVSNGFWDNQDNRKKFIMWLEREMKVKVLEDWYRISLEEIGRFAPMTALVEKGIASVLSETYPDHPWDLEKLSRKIPRKASQRVLAVLLQELLHLDMYEDYFHPDLRFESGRPMQFDIFFPKELLAFEYQGEQHFYDTYSIGPQWIYQQRDLEKRSACKKQGITLIEIPYWWDFTKESLQATIHKYRPDVIPDSGPAKPIPDQKQQ